MELLKSGCSLQEAILLLPEETHWMQGALEAGIPLEQALLEQVKAPWAHHFHFFTKVATLPSAMQSALAMNDFEQQLKQRMLRQSAYPLLLLFMSFGMLQLFTRAILPMMLNSFSMDQEFAQLTLFLHILQVSSSMLLILIFLLAIGVLYLRTQEALRSELLYILAGHITCVRQYCSYQFAGYLKELEDCGVATLDALRFLQEVPILWLQQLAKRMDEQLRQGVDFMEVIEGEAMLTKQLVHNLRMSSLTQQGAQTIQIFLTQQAHYWEHLLKKSGIIIQVIAYVFVGLLVLLVFQILLLPLQMLETM